nr:ATP synthase F0 subunit 8 [Carausius sp.]
MPQMAPMNWIYIYILFITILLMYMSKMYFNKMTTMTNTDNKIIKSNNYWKW